MRAIVPHTKSRMKGAFFFVFLRSHTGAVTHCCHPCETAQKETIYIAEESTESSINEEAAVCEISLGQFCIICLV